MANAPIEQEAVRAAVERLGFDWLYRELTESTNADVLGHFAAQQRDVVACSEAQSAGRGRRGRQWISPHGQNLYCTIGLTKSLPGRLHGLISIVTGLALRRALARNPGVKVGLKWPNDIVVDGAKLGGILIEAHAIGGDAGFFAIGFGLNVNLDAASRAGIETPVASLHEIAAQPVDRNAVLIAAIEAVSESIRGFTPDRVADLVAEFADHDAYYGERIEVIDGEQRIHGIDRGIDESGQLRLETAHGIELHAAAEVSLRPAS